jgi:hypothetical protein
MNKPRNRGISLIGAVIVVALLAAVVMIGRGLLSKPKPVAAAAGGPAGITYVEDRDDSAILVRWDAREGSGQQPAPPLALLLRPTDRYAWWFTGGGPQRLTSDDPKGPESLHLEVTIPGSDAFPVEALGTVCEAGDKPFSHCRATRARVILHRPEYHTEAEAVLMGTREAAGNESLPFEKRPKTALMEFWTQADADDGRQRLAGWVCLEGMKQALDTAPPLATLLSTASDPRLRCFEPSGWMQRLAPGRSGFERQPVYFHCEPLGTCKAAFFYQSRYAEILQEDGWPNAAPWMDLGLFVASWEALERMRLDAIQAPAAMAELDEARIQTKTCEALIDEGKRWVSSTSHGLADDPANSLYPFKAWQSRSLPCRKAAAIVTRLAAIDAAAMEPMLASLMRGLQSLGAHEAEPLFHAWMSALEKAGKADSAQAFGVLFTGLNYLQGYGEYDKKIPQKAARLEQAWKLARTLDPPVPVEQIGPVARALGEMKRTRGDAGGRIGVYEQWVELLARRAAPRSLRLDTLSSLAHIYWESGDFISFKGATDRLRETYLGDATVDPPFSPEREMTAKAAFYAVFNYSNYALHERAFAEVQGDIAAIVARMQRDLGADSRWVKAARFHEGFVLQRQPPPDGSKIGGGFLDY